MNVNQWPLLLLSLFFYFNSSQLFAQNLRTWVAGNGLDSNPCSRTAPCATFAGAISKTAAGGTINCLDSGAFGPVTITKSLTIYCRGSVGNVLAMGLDGITINAGLSDTVILGGLDIEGGDSGLSGIKILQAQSVTINNSSIRNFTVAGVNVVPSSNPVKVTMIDNLITGSATGVIANGAAIIGLITNVITGNSTTTSTSNGATIVSYVAGNVIKD